MAMSKKTSPTSVTFTPRGRQLQIKYVNAFGLKGLINAGLYLFDALSAEDQIALVSRVMAEEKSDREPTVTDDAEYQAGVQAVADAEAYAAGLEEKAAAHDAAKKQSQRERRQKTG